MTLSIILCSALLAGPEPKMTFPELPRDVRKTIDELLSMSDNRISILSSRDSYIRSFQHSSKEHEHFLKLLTTLSGQVDDDLLKKVKQSPVLRVEKNLILIARNYAEHPERYKEIINAYSRAARPDVVAPRSPSLTKEHATKTYRPIWELLLLAPMNRATDFMEMNGANRILEALWSIRSNESIPVLVQAYKATVHKRVPQVTQVADRQLRILAALNRLRSKSALVAILKCLSLSEKAAKNGKTPKTSSYTIRQWISVQFLPDPRWHKVLKEFPTKDLPEKDRKMLQQALRKLQAARKEKKPKP